MSIWTNYSERRLLFEIDWVKRYLGTDPNRTYCSGSSMGGCGAMSFAFRHAEDSASALDELARVGGARQDESATNVWNIDAFVQAPDCDQGIQTSRAEGLEDLLALRGAVSCCVRGHPHAELVAQKLDNRVNLSKLPCIVVRG